MITRLAAALAMLTSFPVEAAELALPAGARQLADRVLTGDSYALPVAGFKDGAIASRLFEGRVERLSWRLEGAGATTLQVLAPLRDQLIASGYDVQFECRDTDCGGFDFRFGIDVIAAPDMHVNIRDYRFLAATQGADDATSLLISRLGEATFVQVIHAATGDFEPVTASAAPETKSDPAQQTALFAPRGPSATPSPDGTLGQTLQSTGHVVLSDLIFETGASRLGTGPFASLQQLAAFLDDNANIRIALVGHTDSTGSLSSNISLSKRRAGSVRERMIDQYAIAGSRIEAEGMGYLAPIASNLSRDGRNENRRVEAILLSQ